MQIFTYPPEAYPHACVMCSCYFSITFPQCTYLPSAPISQTLKTTFDSVMKGLKKITSNMRALFKKLLPTGSFRGWVLSGQGERKATTSSKLLDPVMTGPVPFHELIFFPVAESKSYARWNSLRSLEPMGLESGGTQNLKHCGVKTQCCARRMIMLLWPPARCISCWLCYSGTVQWNVEVRHWKRLTGHNPALCSD